MASFLGFLLPLIVLIVLIALPYAFKGRSKRSQDADEPSGGSSSFAGALSRPIAKLGRKRLLGAAASFVIVFFVAGAPFGVLYVETHESPTLGCNSCHNVMMGRRMGVPPKTFKDRNTVPLVDDSRWMVEHWFYPQVAW